MVWSSASLSFLAFSCVSANLACSSLTRALNRSNSARSAAEVGAGVAIGAGNGTGVGDGSLVGVIGVGVGCGTDTTGAGIGVGPGGVFGGEIVCGGCDSTVVLATVIKSANAPPGPGVAVADAGPNGFGWNTGCCGKGWLTG